jgi:hypothetical protein
MPISPRELLLLFFSATLFKEKAAETSRYVIEKMNEAMPFEKKKHFIWVR